jgi:hypothetical protein
MVIAFDFLVCQGGVAKSSSYPYKATDTDPCYYNSENSIGSISDWVELTSESEYELQLALAYVGPIAVAVDSSLASFQQYQSGIYDDPACNNEPNHAGKIFSALDKKSN